MSMRCGNCRYFNQEYCVCDKNSEFGTTLPEMPGCPDFCEAHDKSCAGLVQKINRLEAKLEKLRSRIIARRDLALCLWHSQKESRFLSEYATLNNLLKDLNETAE